jgi:glycosyltransferase involved in cell wall biosynthesis
VTESRQSRRALWITAEPPNRNGGGGQIRQSYLFTRLAQTMSTDLVVVGGPVDQQVTAAAHAIHALPAPRARKPSSRVVRRLRTLASASLLGGPQERRGAGSPRRRIAAVLKRRDSYDVVLVEHLALAALVRHRRVGERWILTLHNIPSVSAGQAAEQMQGRRQTWVWRRERASAAAYERKLVERYDTVIAVSDSDAAALSDRVVVVPNGVDLEFFTPTPLPKAHRAVFTGSLNYLPNVDGLIWFCSEVLPALRTLVPDVSVSIAGRQPIAEVLALGSIDGVVIHPDVSDVRPLLHSARVAIVPLRMGSGTRLKVLEAMASERPVVGTSVGLAGLGIDNRRQAMIEDEPTAFAAAVATVMTDDRIAHDLAAAGRGHTASSGWNQVSNGLIGVIDQSLADLAVED